MIRPDIVWPRVVAHADMDAFYAAIEQLDDASLRGRPLLIGPPNARGVVLTASYEARQYVRRWQCHANGPGQANVPRSGDYSTPV